jgi:hypothetical protein
MDKEGQIHTARNYIFLTGKLALQSSGPDPFILCRDDPPDELIVLEEALSGMQKLRDELYRLMCVNPLQATIIERQQQRANLESNCKNVRVAEMRRAIKDIVLSVKFLSHTPEDN